MMEREQNTAAGARASAETLILPERPRELHDVLNRRLYHPLARALARKLASTFITPNMVSIIGGGFVVAAAFAYTQPGWPLTALVGLLLHMTWHIVDGADGDLARMTGRSSVRGELIDGICDYTSHIILYLMLGAVMAAGIGIISWIILVLAGASHIVQVNHYEVQRRRYQWWVYGTPWMQSNRAEIAAGSNMAAIITGYLAIAKRFASHEAMIDDAISSAAGDPARLAEIREIIRRAYAAPLSASTLLGANHRTIMLGLSMLVGSPLYHMVYQIIVLNLMLIRSIAVQRRAVTHILSVLPPSR
jgi:phosphatidylglycerophosphate synthase